MQRRKAYWLDSGTLHWRIGSVAGHCAISAIDRIDIDASGRGCRIRQKDGRTHTIRDIYWFMWTREERHRWGGFERRSATYDNFVNTLTRRHQRLQALPGEA